MSTSLIVKILALMACAPVETSAGRPDPALAGPPVKIVGEAESCIRIRQIRQSRVRSDQVIDFEMIGGTIYRSTLPNRCPRLGLEKAFSYATSLNRVCKQDIIRVVAPIAGQLDVGAGCGLGEFVPVEYVESEQ
ncbi:MAG: hypothetical protein AAGI28_05040 [Pseudomonadota bacterium]